MMPTFVTVLLPWVQIIGPVVIIGCLLVIWVNHRRVFKAIREEMDRIEKELGVQAGAFVHVRSRLDRLEGKKFVLRNMGTLPQPRPRDRNGD